MSIVFPSFSLIRIVGEKLLWRGKANWTRFRRLIGNSLRAGSASLLLWPTATMSHSRRLNRQERHFDWVPQWFSAYLPATAGNVVPVFLCPKHAAANAAAESSTRVSRKSLRRRSRTSTYGEKNHRWQACIEKFGRRVTRPARRLPHTRRFSRAFETSIHG